MKKYIAILLAGIALSVSSPALAGSKQICDESFFATASPAAQESCHLANRIASKPILVSQQNKLDTDPSGMAALSHLRKNLTDPANCVSCLVLGYTGTKLYDLASNIERPRIAALGHLRKKLTDPRNCVSCLAVVYIGTTLHSLGTSLLDSLPFTGPQSGIHQEEARV